MKPSILFILHLPPPVHGAAMVGQYIHDSQMINEAFDCHYINLTTAKSLEDIGKFGMQKLWHFLRLLKKIWKDVRKIRPALVYVTPNAKGGAFYKDFIVVELLKWLGCDVVVHYHNKGVATRQYHWLDDKLYRAFFKGLRVILLAEVLYNDVKKYVDKRNVFICPNGIPKEASTIRGYKDESCPHLLYLSNLLIEKGIIVLLDALLVVKNRGYSFVCNVVGGETTDMDSTGFYAEIQKRGLQNNVFYHGRKTGDEKSLFFRNASIFVFPTFYQNECFPLVLLEAMMYGLACVSTTEAGIPNILNDPRIGILVSAKDVNVLVDAIILLLSDRTLCHSMGQAGRDKFEREYTLEVFERRFCEILRQLTIRGNKQQK